MTKEEGFTNIYLLYNDIRKNNQKGTANHLINYYKDGNLDCFIDITKGMYPCYYKDRYLYDFANTKIGPLYNNKSMFTKSKYEKTIDFRKIKTLSESERNEIYLKISKVMEKMENNPEIIVDFYINNSIHYKNICDSYDKINKKEKRLGLVK